MNFMWKFKDLYFGHNFSTYLIHETGITIYYNSLMMSFDFWLIFYRKT